MGLQTQGPSLSLCHLPSRSSVPQGLEVRMQKQVSYRNNQILDGRQREGALLCRGGGRGKGGQERTCRGKDVGGGEVPTLEGPSRGQRLEGSRSLTRPDPARLAGGGSRSTKGVTASVAGLRRTQATCVRSVNGSPRTDQHRAGPQQDRLART